MIKYIIIIIVLFFTLSSCKKYYNCSCTRAVQTLTSISAQTYSTTTTTFTVPVYSTKTNSTSNCAALAGNNGLTTITCEIN